MSDDIEDRPCDTAGCAGNSKRDAEQNRNQRADIQRIPNARKRPHHGGFDAGYHFAGQFAADGAFFLHAKHDAGHDAADVRLSVEKRRVAREQLFLLFLIAGIELFSHKAEHTHDGGRFHALHVLRGKVPEHPAPVTAAHVLLGE
ncbi:hypothetical protein SDC9_95561 [bioreactor metagenome]|uniref:Uncharacterized protein n=1 Tax=bioreactor metagenome TaxID=1076179 RepID=A0A645AGS0_9ZZZZ